MTAPLRCDCGDSECSSCGTAQGTRTAEELTPAGNPLLPQYALIPRPIRRAIDGHALHGRPTGGFVRAVLENDLIEAFILADESSTAALRGIVFYVYHEIPSACWGSRKKVKAWLEKFRTDAQGKGT